MDKCLLKIEYDELIYKIRSMKVDEEFTLELRDTELEPLYFGIKKINLFDVESFIIGAYGGYELATFTCDEDLIDRNIIELIEYAKDYYGAYYVDFYIEKKF